MEANGTVIVANYAYRHEAELAMGYLEDAGIAAAVSVDDAGGGYASLSFVAGSARLRVREEDTGRALEVLRAAGSV